MSASSENRFPEGVVLTAAALLGAVMVLAGLVLGRQALDGPADGGIETAADDGATTTEPGDDVETTPPTEGPDPDADPDGGDGTATTEPPPDVVPLDCPTGVDVVICDAARFVQIEREHPFRTFPEVEILPDAEFDEALLDDFDDYRDELADWEVTMTGLGLVEPEVDLVQAYRDSLSSGVVGFYDTGSGRLVVRGEDFGLYAQLVLVHELTHALDDQWFDLDREMADAEADYGFAAVIEGNAVRVETAWREGLGGDEQGQLAAEESTALTSDDMAALLALPPVILELDYSPYTDGLIYVSTLAAGGGEAAVDDALSDPPASSEEILHPSTDREVDPEVQVDVPPAGGPAAEQGRLGELVVRQWLGRSAATGWGGDGFVSWIDDGGRSCVTVDLVGDGESDQAELRSAVDAWVAEAGDRTVEEVPVSEGVVAVRASGCR